MLMLLLLLLALAHVDIEYAPVFIIKATLTECNAFIKDGLPDGRFVRSIYHSPGTNRKTTKFPNGQHILFFTQQDLQSGVHHSHWWVGVLGVGVAAAHCR